MKIVGLDLSINSSGCVSWELGNMKDTYKIMGFTDTKKWESENILSYKNCQFHSKYGRTNWFIERIVEFCEGASIISVEDYSLNSTGLVFNIAEFCGQIKMALFNKGYQIFEIPPTVHKKFTTDNGRADKVKTTDCVFEKFSFLKENQELRSLNEYVSPQCDIIDAISLCYTLEHKINLENDFEKYSRVLSKEQLEVMKSISKKNKIPFYKRVPMVDYE